MYRYIHTCVINVIQNLELTEELFHYAILDDTIVSGFFQFTIVVWVRVDRHLPVYIILHVGEAGVIWA